MHSTPEHPWRGLGQHPLTKYTGSSENIRRITLRGISKDYEEPHVSLGQVLQPKQVRRYLQVSGLFEFRVGGMGLRVPLSTCGRR